MEQKTDKNQTKTITNIKNIAKRKPFKRFSILLGVIIVFTIIHVFGFTGTIVTNLGSILQKKDVKEFVQKTSSQNEFFPYEDKENKRFSGNTIIVKFKPNKISGLPESTNFVELSEEISLPYSIKVIAQKNGVDKLKRIAPINTKLESLKNVLVLQVNNPEKAVQDFSKDPNVEHAALDYYFEFYAPNDPLFSKMWHLDNEAQDYYARTYESPGFFDADIDLPEAFEVSYGSQEVIVAVIDGGVDYNHEDLGNNMWVNNGEIPNNGIDDDGNGYIDDIYGYDFSDNDSDPKDYHGHGTHCAGIIAAETDNNIGTTGICPQCKIMALKFFPEALTSLAIEALAYAVDNGAVIVNNSYGCRNCYNQEFQDVINNAYTQGVFFIAAAGNDNILSTNYYPASYEHSFSVAATNNKDRKAYFSNYGPEIDVSAPGCDILSLRAENTNMYFIDDEYTRILNSQGEPDDDNGKYMIASGTSMAAPIVAGLAGLALSRESMPLYILEDHLKFYADNIDHLNPNYEGELGFGRVNANYFARELIPSNYNCLTIKFLTQLKNSIWIEISPILNFELENIGSTNQEDVIVNLYINDQLINSYSYDLISPGQVIGSEFEIDFSQLDLDLGKTKILIEVEPGNLEFYLADNYDSQEVVVYNYNSEIGISVDNQWNNSVFDCEAQGLNPIIGSGSGIGIEILAENVTIQNCHVENFGIGIYIMYSCASTTIISNDIVNNKDGGINIQSQSNEVSYNNISNNSNYGIYVGKSNNYIINNELGDNGHYEINPYNDASAIYVYGWSDNYIADNYIHHSPNFGIYVLHADNNIIENNNISNSRTIGISITGNAENNTIQNNTIRRNSIQGIGMYSFGSCYDVNNNNIENNEIIKNWVGIVLGGELYTCTTNNNTVQNNIINSTGLNISDDIYTYGLVPYRNSGSNTILNNRISGFDLGFYEFISIDNIVSNNRANNNKHSGFWLTGGNGNNYSNNIANHNGNYGLYLAPPNLNVNVFTSNHFCYNGQYDIYSAVGFMGTSSNMCCDTFYGSLECDYPCNFVRKDKIPSIY